VTTNETTLREVGAGGGEVLFSWTDGKQDEGAGHGVAVGSLNHPRHAGLDPVGHDQSRTRAGLFRDSDQKRKGKLRSSQGIVVSDCFICNVVINTCAVEMPTLSSRKRRSCGGN
jgi:hypothetical protein